MERKLKSAPSVLKRWQKIRNNFGIVLINYKTLKASRI